MSESDIEVTFEGDDGTPVVPELGEGAGLINGDPEFERTYRLYLRWETPDWPEKLAGAAQRAAKESFPAGETVEADDFGGSGCQEGRLGGPPTLTARFRDGDHHYD